MEGASVIMKNFLGMLTHNWIWKLSALAFAIALWSICMNVISDDPSTDPISLPLKINGIEQLSENNIVIQNQESIENSRISVRVKGKFSDVQALKRNLASATAYIDMSPMDMRYSKEMGIELRAAVYVSLPHGLEWIEISPATVPVILDKHVIRTMNVSVNAIGDPAENYKDMEGVSSPETVRVSGPQTLLNQISQVRVDIDITGATEEVIANATLKAYDSNNQEITGITIEPDTADITIPIEKRGRISIAKPQYSGNPAPGYTVVDVEWEPKYVQVIGSEDAINNAPPIVIDPTTFNVEGWTETGSYPYDLRGFLVDQDISIENGTPQRLTVTAIVERLSRQTFEIPVSKLTIKGLTRGVEFLDDTVTVTVEGRESLMADLTQDDIAGSLSLIGYDPGEHVISVSFMTPKDISVIGDEPTVTVVIPQEGEETEPIDVNPAVAPPSQEAGPSGEQPIEPPDE